MTDADTGFVGKLADWTRLAGMVCLAMSALTIVWAVTFPVSADLPPAQPVGGSSLASPREPAIAAEAVARKVAGSRLIRPSQAVAAVRDSGVAAELAKRLRLTGVAEVGSELVAYVDVEKQGMQSVRQGQKLLEFTVQEIRPGGVTLVLDGVAVVLGE